MTADSFVGPSRGRQLQTREVILHNSPAPTMPYARTSHIHASCISIILIKAYYHVVLFNPIIFFYLLFPLKMRGTVINY